MFSKGRIFNKEATEVCLLLPMTLCNQLQESMIRKDISLVGQDLSKYGDEIENDRSLRSRNLRSSINLTRGTRICNSDHNFYASAPRSKFGEEDGNQIELKKVIKAFKSGNNDEIISLCSALSQTVEINKTVVSMAHTEQFYEAFEEVLNNNDDKDVVQALLSLSVSLFPYFGEYQDRFCDLLLFSLTEYLTVNNPILPDVVNLIGIFSSHSSYARDALLCSGVCTGLIELAKQNRGSRVADICCEALKSIFSNPEPVSDIETFKDIAPNVFDLLDGQSIEATRSIISCFTAMANHIPSVVLVFFSLGLYNSISDFLRNEKLLDVALRLIGNLVNCETDQITYLLDNGVFDILNGLLDTKYSSDVMWIYSNSIKPMPELAVRFLDSSFLERIYSIFEGGSCECKIEASYLLETIMMFSPKEKWNIFMNDRFFSCLSESLGSCNYLVVQRCCEVISTLYHYAVHNNNLQQLSSLVRENDITIRLNDAIESLDTNVDGEFDIDNRPTSVREGCIYILNQLEDCLKSNI